MPSSRRLIRNDFCEHLIRAGVWSDRVHNARVCAFSDDDEYPAVVVYCDSDRTVDIRNDRAHNQECILHVELKFKVPTDQQSTVGPSAPGTVDQLDDACDAVRSLICSLYSNRDVDFTDGSICFDTIDAVDCDTSMSDDGEFILMQGIIDAKLRYVEDIPGQEFSGCSLNHILGLVEDVPAQNRFNNPYVSECE